MTLLGSPRQVSAAWMRLTPRAPTASCCSCAVLSSIRMWIRIWLGGSLPWHYRTIGHEHHQNAWSSTPVCHGSEIQVSTSLWSQSTKLHCQLGWQQRTGYRCQFGRQQKDMLSRTCGLAPHCCGRSWYLIPSQPWHSLFLLNALAVTVSANAKKAVSRPLCFRSVRLTCSQQGSLA